MEDKENHKIQIAPTTPQNSKKRTVQQRKSKVLSPNNAKSPHKKKPRRVSFAAMKVVFDENQEPKVKPKTPRRTSIAGIPRNEQKQKRNSIAGLVKPKNNLISIVEEPSNQPEKLEDEENLESFKQELVKKIQLKN
jgi:hypothetical protein